MNSNATQRRRPAILPFVAGGLLLGTLGWVGIVAPLTASMFIDFGVDPLPFSVLVMSKTHWQWTVPVGACVLAGLVYGSRRWSRKTALIASAATLVAAALILVGFAGLCRRGHVGLHSISAPQASNAPHRTDGGQSYENLLGRNQEYCDGVYGTPEATNRTKTGSSRMYNAGNRHIGVGFKNGLVSAVSYVKARSLADAKQGILQPLPDWERDLILSAYRPHVLAHLMLDDCGLL